MEKGVYKVCLNCRGNWDLCEGHRCICGEAVCCDADNGSKEGEEAHVPCAFGYVWSGE